MKIRYLIILIVITFGIFRLYDYLTDDFRLGNITHSIPNQEEWAIPQPSSNEEKELDQILTQPFHYLGKGSQSYAFVSDDGGYVLKFFKFKHLRPNWFYEISASLGLFKEQHAKQAARKERKLWGVFRSYKLAYSEDRPESGLIFIQLNTSGNPRREITVRDKIGLRRTIDLQNYTFILQRKGESLEVVLDRLLKQGDVKSASTHLDQIFDLYASEYRKGIYDRDHAVMRNFGFIGDQPIHMDVGKLTADGALVDKQRSKADALLVDGRMKHWIKKYYPQYSEGLSARIDQKIQKLYD